MKPNQIRSWNSESDHLLRMMAKAGWSVHMAAAQLDRLPYDVETRAGVLDVTLSDRTAGKPNDPTAEAIGKAADAVAKSQVRKVPGDVLP